MNTIKHDRQCEADAQSRANLTHWGAELRNGCGCAAREGAIAAVQLSYALDTIKRLKAERDDELKRSAINRCALVDAYAIIANLRAWIEAHE